MASSNHRTAFVFGVLVGAAAGATAAFWNAPQTGRATRAKSSSRSRALSSRRMDANPFQATVEDRVAARSCRTDLACYQ